MCGIAGIFAYGKGAEGADVPALELMRDAMAHRGPDGSGLWVSSDRRVALAHRRLSIIDLSAAGAQPMNRDSVSLCVSYNGEIYNYREIRDELTRRGHTFQSQSDTEVLLRGYEEYGEGLVKRLRGMFAFAIWDGRRRGLLLARDHFGIKPLYYMDDGQRICLASEVKAFKAAGLGTSRLSAAGQVSFLLWGSILEPHTLYADIQALPAGATMWIHADGPRRPERYWSETEVLREAQGRSPTTNLRAEFREPIRAHLRHAVVDSLRHHFVSDVPVGLFLSAGRDSSTLMALASEEDIAGLRSLTLGFDEYNGTGADEVAVAGRLAAKYHSTHAVRRIGADRFAGAMGRILAAMDQPSIDGVNSYFVSEAAAAAGWKVAISGLGADELFAGYQSFHQIPRLVAGIGKLPGAASIGRALRVVTAPMIKRFTSPKYASLFELGASYEDAYLLRRGLFMPWELPDILDPEVVKEGWRELAVRARLATSVAGLREPRARVTALEMSVYMRNQLLRDSDWAAMAHSLEVRVPFVDHVLFKALAPFLMGPTQLTKSDLVAVLRTPLPQEILARPKTGFGVPIRAWLDKNTETRGLAGERGLRGWAKKVLGHHVEARSDK